MANIKSAIKRAELNEKAHTRNAEDKSAMRTAIKRYETAVEAGADNVQELYRQASSAVDKGHSKGLIHKNKASRTKSRLAAKMAK